MTIHDLPAVNATLNAISGVLLVIGYLLIRARRIELHRRFMIAAFVASSLFLVCYSPLPRIGRFGAVHAAGLRATFVHDPDYTCVTGGDRPAAGHSRSRGLQAKYTRHRAIARWTLPIWLYVSVTGVLVYVLLYQPTWLL